MGKPYNTTAVHENLVKLSEHPFDLTATDALSSERINGYVLKSAYFDLHYWSQRLDDRVLKCLQQLADNCNLVEQFKSMKTGAVINTIKGFESENRQVLHTASRDLFSDEPNAPDATSKAKVELTKLNNFLQDVDDNKIVNSRGEPFTTLIHIGIGGSDLGPRSVYEALKSFSIKGRKALFISNVDPDDAAAVLTGVDISKALVLVVSKSGTTLETLANERFVRDYYESHNLNPDAHFLAVTGEASPMDDPSKYLCSFYMFDYIGGRYSTTSMVGAVTLGFCLGFDNVMDFLRGASQVDSDAENTDIRKNLPLLLALLGIWNHSYLRMSTVAVLPYSQSLHRFTAHLQQCDMESNGKSINREGQDLQYKSGPIVWGEPGTNGQHAFYQLLHQGTEIVPCEFIGFRKSQRGRDVHTDGTTSQQKLLANMLAQSVALATGQENENKNKLFPGNRPSCILIAEKLTPEVMGALLAIYEAKIIFQGFAWDINSFDQEGVQLGKVLATKFLKEIIDNQSVDTTLEKSILQSTGTV